MAAGSGPGSRSCRPWWPVVRFGLWSAGGLAAVVQVSTVRLVASILSAPAGGTQSRARPTGRRQWCRAGISTVVSWVRRLCSDHQAGVTPNGVTDPLPATIEAFSIERRRRTCDERCRAMTWLRLSEATTLIHHDVQKARERLQRAISKAWLVPSEVLPLQTSDPNVPLRIQVTLPSGLRIVGRDWLEKPVLHWETTEIECLCNPWAPMGRVATEPR